MQCPRCQQDNPSLAKFCPECGTALKSSSESGRPAASYAVLHLALREALDRENASSEILRVISSSPNDLWNPPTPYHAKAVENLKAIAPSLAIDLSVVSVRAPEEITPAFEAVKRAHAQALYVIDSPLFFTHRAHILRAQLRGPTPPIRGVRRQDPQGRQA